MRQFGKPEYFLFSNTRRELSYIGSKEQDIIEEDKGYGILTYNIADCLIYEYPQSLIQALGYM